jgi:membrane protein implicated in regulation of membrane protease activity
VIKAVLTTLTALMITAFMVRDGTFDSATTVMAAILWGMAVYLWWRLRRRNGEEDRLS